MKQVTLAAVLILGLAVVAFSQQTRRRGLDQLDLLTLPSSNQSAGNPVTVDLQTFQLLEPLVRYCRDLELSYKSEVLDKPGPLTLAGYDSVFREKGIAIHRSLLLIRKMSDASPQIRTLLDETDTFGKDASLVMLTMQFPDEPDAKKELAALRKKYNASDATEPKVMVGMILSRLNANFARLRVAQ